MPLPGCLHCGAAELREWAEFGAFHQITSDCRPWRLGGRLGLCRLCGTVQKPLTDDWLAECKLIYANYHAYHQGKGAEESVFAPDGSRQARSSAFVAWVMSLNPLPAQGRLLDFGCGNGNLLTTVSERFPAWQLTGADVSDLHRQGIENIPNAEWRRSMPIGDLPGPFDMITAVHLLEHLPQPGPQLRLLAEKLGPEGRLAIEVPSLEANPFDLLIADHASHFTPTTLRRLLRSCGLDGPVVDDVIPREISALVAYQGHGHSGLMPQEPRALVEATERLVERHLAWLADLRDLARTTRGQSRKLALMGSSVGACWLAGELHGEVDWFVDEDPHRIGGTLLDIPILAPADLSTQAALLLPMPIRTASTVALRLQALGLTPILPPRW